MMGSTKPDTTYGIKRPPADTPDDDEELTEVTRLHELLEEKLKKSREKLNGVARKGDALKLCLKRSDSVSNMQAVLSQPPKTAVSDK